MITIVELPEFIRKIKNLLPEKEKENLINYLAENPKSGIVIQGTGGIRKIRWKKESTGKSGGIRVIYFLENESYPLFLLTVFGKSEKDNLTRAERNELAKFVKILIETYGENNE